MAILDFDPNTVEGGDMEFTPIPQDEYLCHIIETAMIATKAGDGAYLKLTLEVLDGPYARRLVWDNLNLKNPKEQTVEIAQRSLKHLCEAVGLPFCHDSDELCFKPFIASIAISVDKNNRYPPSNRVKRYKARAGAAPPKAVAARSAEAKPATVRSTATPEQLEQATQTIRHARPQTNSGVSKPWLKKAAPPARAKPEEEVPF